MLNYAKHFSKLSTPQTEQADPLQVKNDAGGFVFKVDKWQRLSRFIILGCDGGTYYASERKLTRESAKVVEECCAEDPVKTVRLIADISKAGRAPKNDPAIFALAICAADKSGVARAEALKALPEVCRIATHLFQFAEAVQEMRGWGRGLRNAVALWYSEKSAKDLMFQVTKYAQRNGWSHRDLFRLVHPKTNDPQMGAVYRYIVTGSDSARVVENKRTGVSKTFSDVNFPAYLNAFQEMKAQTNPLKVAELIREWNFTHEMVPSESKKSREVWEALAERMPMTALIRNLAKLTAVGVIQPLGKDTARIAERISSAEELKKARVHPISVLSALKVYSQGHGEKGSLTWQPNQRIVDALNEGFYQAFGAVDPTGKATMLALDVSGSMTHGDIAGIPGLTPRDVSAALAMVTARVEPNYHIAGFSGGMMELKISPQMRLDQVLQVMHNLPFDRTDCSLPMRWATRYNVGVEAFIIATDNETYGGPEHVHQSLVKHRKATGFPAKLCVMAMTVSEFTIANPNDSGMLDCVGADASTPQIISDFIRG